MKRQRNAKIIATLGPSSSDPQVIRQLFEAEDFGAENFPPELVAQEEAMRAKIAGN